MPVPLRCLAVTAPGLGPLAAAELRRLGIVPGAPGDAGVEFAAGPRDLARANLELRTVSRVLVRVAEFPARAFYELERKAGRVPWEEFVAPGAAVRFRVTSRKSRLYHQDGIAERLAHCASGPRSTVYGTRSSGAPPDEDEAHPEDQLFVVRVMRDVVTISADSSGALLHRRGYRLASAKAPLRETLAAALLLGAGYQEGIALADPFCGSGTIPIEAALLARRIAPGLRRRFALERWPSFDQRHLAEVREEAAARVLPRAGAPIVGSDRDAGAIRVAAENAARAGVAEDITFREAAFSDMLPPAERGLLATNPPYGVRVGRGADLRDLYAALGAGIRARWNGWTVAMITAGEMPGREAGLSFETRWESNNGGIPIRLEVHDGTAGSHPGD